MEIVFYKGDIQTFPAGSDWSEYIRRGSLHYINIPKLDQHKNISQPGEIAATLRFSWVILGDTGEGKEGENTK